MLAGTPRFVSHKCDQWILGDSMAEGFRASPLCLSVHYKGMLGMTARTAHITYRWHYITKLAASC